MRPFRKIKTITALLLCAAFTACSGGKFINYEAAIAKKVPISFSWWGNDGRIMYTMEGVRLFESLNNDIEVKCKYGVWTGYNKRQNIYMLSHDEPDVMQINFDWIKKYSPEGDGFYNLYQLSDYIDLTNFSENDLSYGEVNGKLNAIPIALNAHSIFVNKDIYTKYGLDIPKSWDDYFNAAKVMSKDGIYPLSMGDKPLFFFVISYFEQTTGKKVCNEDGELTLTKDDIKYMLEFYKRLYDEKVLMPIQDSDFASFATGGSAATMRWISGSQSLFNGLFKQMPEIVVAPYPTISGDMENTENLGWYAKPATLYAISSKTEHPEAAAKLINFLLNSGEMAKLQKTEKGIPISQNAINTLKASGELDNLDYVATEQMLETGNKMTLIPSVLESGNVYKGFYNNAAYYIYGEYSLEQTADIIYNEFYPDNNKE